ncbi:MAG: hypothetical protein PHI85_04955 [Victivallaceae bacterium]|nr:hypothetical protein [Victivallaceae bacterium]
MAKTLFRFNTRQLSASVQRELLAQPFRVRRAMDAVGGFLNSEAKDLAPVDEGFLTAEISNDTVRHRKSCAAVIYVPANAASSEYAIPMHEGVYDLGPKSLDKQTKVGKPVGKKFITRALDGHRDDIVGIIKSEVKI